MVKEAKQLNSISTEGGFFIFYLDQAFRRICGRATCGKMNRCFGTNALYTSEDNVNLQLYTDFPDQTIMAQSGNGAACESDVTSHDTGQELNFDDGTLKGKDSYNC